ncbi:DUF4019 domain-containing protein [Alteromonas sp. KUL42]|nr:DUF4019 domain-containing protein [Alteromonas sp. KUL42]
MKIDTQKLIHLRNTKAWSQQHLADVSGLSLRTIQRIEKTQSASQDSVKAIAAAFDVTPDRLLIDESVQVMPQLSQSEDHSLPHPHPHPHPKSSGRDGFFASQQNLMWLIIAIITTLCVTVYWSQSVNANDSAKKVVEAGALVDIDETTLQDGLEWLELVDTQQYEKSWDESSPIFRTSVTQAKWVEAMLLVRKPFGEADSRKLEAAQAPASLPGLPDGEYLILTFTTKFSASSLSSTETLSLVKEDGHYRAIGYFIR